MLSRSTASWLTIAALSLALTACPSDDAPPVEAELGGKSGRDAACCDRC